MKFAKAICRYKVPVCYVLMEYFLCVFPFFGVSVFISFLRGSGKFLHSCTMFYMNFTKGRRSCRVNAIVADLLPFPSGLSRPNTPVNWQGWAVPVFYIRSGGLGAKRWQVRENMLHPRHFYPRKYASLLLRTFIPETYIS